jgi:eukaryotic-like serine/threonine-protein kinase
LDGRTDLFSFGLVIYEMATGRAAFRVETALSIQDEILPNDPPSIFEMNPGLPIGLEKIVSKALQKKPEDRYQSAAEMRSDLETLRQRVLLPKDGRRWVQACFAFVALAGAAATIWMLGQRALPPPSPPEFKLRQITANSAENHILNGSISPDGIYLAYADLKGLHLKRIASDETKTIFLPGQTVDTYNNSPAWFPDSRSFLVNTLAHSHTLSDQTPLDATIVKVLVPTGDTQKLRENAFAWAVSPDGSQVAFAAHEGRFGPREVWLMRANGTGAHMLFSTEEESGIGPFGWSPDGQRLGYAKTDANGDAGYSRDLKGGPPVQTVAPETHGILGVLPLPDNRVLYAIQEPGAFDDTCNFWTARTDPKTLKVIEKLQRLTNWTGFCMNPTSSSSDGKRIAFAKWANHRTVYMADLDSTGTEVLRSRHFTLDERNSTPVDWTPDGQYLLFASKRNGNPALFRQHWDSDTEERIQAPGTAETGRLSPDGSWLIQQVAAQQAKYAGELQLIRTPPMSGPTEAFSKVRPGTQLSCARLPSTRCVIAEPTEDHRYGIVTLMDPLRGRGAELAHFVLDPKFNWIGRISNDGSRFAVITEPAGPIRILSLRGKPERDIPARELKSKGQLQWASRGQGLYLTNAVKGGSDLYYVDIIQGYTKKLWHNDSGFLPVALPSPDGRHLAIQGASLDENMWLMEFP